ncbi:MAG: hypothetical protein DRQ78_13080 [Epsilonproteobacteria bacterium]|nr:MAG: hypothetical protein DRQ78_13080 [Campylobacterota bacterium]
MAGVIDTIYTFRFLKILSTKWENTDAYKLGIVDADGTPLKKSSELTTTEEKKAYTPFVRLVFKLKRMMGKIPGGKSAVARYGAALALIKENSNEVEKMGVNLKALEEGLKKYIGAEDISEVTIKYSSKNQKDVEEIVKIAIGYDLDVDEDDGILVVKGDKSSSDRLSKRFNKFIVAEETTNKAGGIEGKDQPLGKKGEIKRRKPKKKSGDDEVVSKDGQDTDDKKNEDTKYHYQVIGGVLIRVDEKKRVVKKRVVGGKRQKKREYKATKRINKRGNRKLRGAKKSKWKRSHKKAYRKAHTSSASAKRRRSNKKGKKYRK